MKKLLWVIAVILLFTACGNKNTDTAYTHTEENNTVTEQKQIKEITLYYSEDNASYLVPELREIPGDKADDAEYILNELIKGSKDAKLVNAVPEDTRVISCTVENGICTVNLSKEFLEKNGTASERMAIYSIVNTMCSIDGVEKVQFLIDGEKVMIFGSYIFDEPFEADMSIVQE